MTSSKRETRQSSSQSTPQHRAKFVELPEIDSKDESFKYKAGQRFNWTVAKFLLGLKRRINTAVQGSIVWLTRNVHLREMRDDSIVWIAEAAIEGLTANFATHFILGWDFNLFTVLAHGFAIKQAISIVWRLRKNGGTEPISEKKR